MAKAPYIYGTIDTVLMASHNDHHNYITGFLKYYQHPANRTYPNNQTLEINRNVTTEQKNSTLKSHDHESESRNKFKNSLLKITQRSPQQITFGHFFARCAVFVRHHFLPMPHLSIPGGVFVMCHLCKVSLFPNGIKGCHFCWVYLMVMSNCNYLLLFSSLKRHY